MGTEQLTRTFMNARYNSRHPMTNPFRHWSAAVIAVVLALCAAGWAADWNEPASQLAKDVVAITGPGAASISYRNISNLPNDQTDVIRRALENQLRADGIRLATAATAAAEIRITFSENAQSYL